MRDVQVCRQTWFTTVLQIAAAAVSLVLLPVGSTYGDDRLDSVVAGRAVFFHRCVVCHEPPSLVGLTKEELSSYDASLPASPDELTSRGPPLSGLIGRPAGSQPGFEYSDALKEVNFAWTSDRLRQFLLKPSAFIPGNLMRFNGLKREGEMEHLIAYLEATTTAADPL